MFAKSKLFLAQNIIFNLKVLECHIKIYKPEKILESLFLSFIFELNETSYKFKIQGFAP